MIWGGEGARRGTVKHERGDEGMCWSTPKGRGDAAANGAYAAENVGGRRRRQLGAGAHQADPLLLNEDVTDGDEGRVPQQVLRRSLGEGGLHALLR